MRALAVLLAAACLAGSSATPAALAGPPHHPDNKAAQHAAERERKAFEQAMHRQAEADKKLMQEQRHFVEQQMKAQKHLVEQQQKAIQAHQQQQVKAIQQAQAQAAHPSKPANGHGTPAVAAMPAYHVARPYYGHYSYGHHRYRATRYRPHPTYPTTQDPGTMALHRLRASLDAVRVGQSATPAESASIKKALMGVIEVPKVPKIATIGLLAGELTDALAHRESPQAQTGPMALTLRGVMNSYEMPNIDLTEFMNEHRAALKASKVRPAEVAAVMDSLKTVEAQERAHR